MLLLLAVYLSVLVLVASQDPVDTFSFPVQLAHPSPSDPDQTALHKLPVTVPLQCCPTPHLAVHWATVTFDGWLAANDLDSNAESARTWFVNNLQAVLFERGRVRGGDVCTKVENRWIWEGVELEALNMYVVAVRDTTDQETWGRRGESGLALRSVPSMFSLPELAALVTKESGIADLDWIEVGVLGGLYSKTILQAMPERVNKLVMIDLWDAGKTRGARRKRSEAKAKRTVWRSQSVSERLAQNDRLRTTGSERPAQNDRLRTTGSERPAQSDRLRTTRLFPPVSSLLSLPSRLIPPHFTPPRPLFTHV